MARQFRLAYLFGVAVLLCGTSFGQFISLTVERIINDESMSAFEKKAHLIEIGDEGVPALLSYLDAHSESWRLIVSVLGDIGDQRATEPLLKRLNSDPTELRAVILALGKLKDPRAVEPLVALIGKVRGEEAMTALGQIGDPRAGASIFLVLNSEDESIENRILAASVLLKMASDDVRAEAISFLLQDEYLHELHRQQKPDGHPYWRFPHAAWWEALAAVNSDDSQATLARWLGKPLILYDQGALIKRVGEITNPSREIIEALFWSAETNNPGEVYYSTLALEALLKYGRQVDSDRLLAAIDEVVATTEKWPSPESSDSSSGIIERLAKLRAEVAKTSGFVSRGPGELDTGPIQSVASSQEIQPEVDPPSMQTSLIKQNNTPQAAEAATPPEEPEAPESPRWSGGKLVVFIGAVVFVLAFAGYRVFSKKGRSGS